MVDMIFKHSCVNVNPLYPRRLYAKAFLKQQLPSQVTFQTVFQQLKCTDSCKKKSYDTGGQVAIGSQLIGELFMSNSYIRFLRRLSDQQQHFSLDICLSMLGNRMLEPVVLLQCLTHTAYLSLKILFGSFLKICQRFGLMQDGAFCSCCLKIS